MHVFCPWGKIAFPLLCDLNTFFCSGCTLLDIDYWLKIVSQVRIMRWPVIALRQTCPFIGKRVEKKHVWRAMVNGRANVCIKLGKLARLGRMEMPLTHLKNRRWFLYFIRPYAFLINPWFFFTHKTKMFVILVFIRSPVNKNITIQRSAGLRIAYTPARDLEFNCAFV